MKTHMSSSMWSCSLVILKMAHCGDALKNGAAEKKQLVLKIITRISLNQLLDLTYFKMVICKSAASATVLKISTCFIWFYIYHWVKDQTFRAFSLQCQPPPCWMMIPSTLPVRMWLDGGKFGKSPLVQRQSRHFHARRTHKISFFLPSPRNSPAPSSQSQPALAWISQTTSGWTNRLEDHATWYYHHGSVLCCFYGLVMLMMTGWPVQL